MEETSRLAAFGLDAGHGASCDRRLRRLPRRRVRTTARASLVGLGLLLVGCGPSEPPAFRSNLEGYEPQRVHSGQRDALRAPLKRLFGTPDEPLAPPQTDLELALLQAAAGPIRSDEQGRQFGLYRQHCAECHGISGDGAGPTALVQNPHPRDFRHGIFKYTRTAGGAKPVRQDLQRAIERGIPATAMPSFSKLSGEELDALVQYVEYLSIRGETELLLVNIVVEQDEYPLHMDDVMADCLAPVVEMWRRADDDVVEPPAPPPTDSYEQKRASIKRGREIYLGQNARCSDCHGRDGRGDGPQAGQLYDFWNERKKRATPEHTQAATKLYRLPLAPLRPRNFTEGTFRGGARPLDLYWRIHVGIKGTPMPAAGPTAGSPGTISENDIWHVVHYVLSLAQKTTAE